ncbi:Redoxin [Pedobacter steynii]|uniref:Redoxin n=1 Tax=Pedobacter steynii TaxID=430522 RepID=A0A1G9TYC7_9SPHI|nr:redoxin family protein [Pedobacter steynii]NQX40599.1 redoxin family protein [Pedobacter steynii]SDM52611.1 Redoxin [Pedobacter steynii]
MTKRLAVLFSLIMLNFTLLKAQNNASTISSSKIIRLNYPESLKDLIKQFKGKIIYIDVMASWCKPCIEEFKYTKELDDFFQEKDIVYIYITIDEKSGIEKAYDVIKENSLNGYFVSYHNPVKKTESSDYVKFIDDLLFVVDDKGNRGFKGIPIYSILDKEGQIVVKDALRPSSKEKLKEQLNKYL